MANASGGQSLGARKRGVAHYNPLIEPFSIKLTAENPTFSFTWMEDDEDGRKYDPLVFIDGASLPNDVLDEYNVVDVVTNGVNGEVSETFATLNRSGNLVVCLDDCYEPPITLRLKTGSGPVILTGRIMSASIKDFIDTDSDKE